VTINYDKPNRRLTLTATIGPGLLPPPENNNDRPGERSLMFGIAGTGFEPAIFGYEPVLGVSWGVAESGDLVLLLEIRFSLDLPVSWNGVGHVCTLFALLSDHPPVGHVRRTDGLLPYNGGMQRTAVARNGTSPSIADVSRAQAAADADGLLRAEGLEMSLEHQALSARWVAGEIDSEELERLGLEIVRQRLADTTVR
jgi:Antitoxin VbhA